MIPQNLYPEWKQLVELTKEIPYGHFYSHEELAGMMKLSKNHPRYFAQIQKWKRAMLKDHWRYVQVRQGEGYRIVEPKEHDGIVREWGRKGQRRYKIGVATPTEMLTTEENLRLSNTLAKFGNLLSMCKQTMRETRPSLPITKLADRPKMLSKS